MKIAETTFGLAVLIFGGLMLRESLKLDYYVQDVPGPGFLPVWVALGTVVLGAGLVLQGVRASHDADSDAAWPSSTGWLRIAVVWVGLAVVLVVLESAGFLVSAALFSALVAVGLGVRSWRLLATMPVLSAAALYVIFALWLRVPLPKGILGIFS